jgi:hypothetical protein
VFLACQHLSLGANLRECEDQSLLKVLAVLGVLFRSILLRVHPGYAYLRLTNTAVRYSG